MDRAKAEMRCTVSGCGAGAVSEGACARHAEMRAAARRLTQRIGRQIEAEFRAKFYDGCWSAGWSPFDALPAERVLQDARDEMLDGYAYIRQAREQVAKAVAALDDAYQETVSCTACACIDRARKALTGVVLRQDPKPPPEPPPDRMGKDRDVVSHAPDATWHPGDRTTDRADRDYGDEGPDDDSPAADARFRSLAAEPDTDLLNRLARLEETVRRKAWLDEVVRGLAQLEETVRGLEAGNRMLEATVASMRAQNDRLARRADRIDGRL